MTEKFSRDGSYTQGNFNSHGMNLYKVTKQFCQTLQIGQINTTSYHLQTNGTLERWHEEKGDDGESLPSLRLSRETFVPTPTQQAALIYRCCV